MAAEDLGEVAFGGEGEVVADEVDGTIVFGRGKQAGDFEALAGFGGHVFCLADGVHDAFGELDGGEAAAQGAVDVGEAHA